MVAKRPPPNAQPAVSPSRKLTREEHEKVTQRLFYQQQERSKALEEKRRQTLDAVGLPSSPLSKDAEEGLVQRIYATQIDKKKRMMEENEKKRAEMTASAKTIDQNELQDMVQRMYYQQRDKIEHEAERLRSKYQPERDKKTLGKEQIDTMGKRLCYGSLEKKKELRQKVFDKYIAPMDPPKKKISKDDIQSMAQRLCTTKK